MGTDDPGIPADGESPQRPVYVDSFYMDIHEVTNQQFQSFVSATGHITEVRMNLALKLYFFSPDLLKQNELNQSSQSKVGKQIFDLSDLLVN